MKPRDDGSFGQGGLPCRVITTSSPRVARSSSRESCVFAAYTSTCTLVAPSGLLRLALQRRDDDGRSKPMKLTVAFGARSSDPAVDQAWAKEIERRVAELDSGTVRTVPWETVKAKLLGRLRES